MRRGGPLYKPGNTHQKKVPPSATYSIFYSITVCVNTWANFKCVHSSRGFDAYAIVKLSTSFCNDKIKKETIVYIFICFPQVSLFLRKHHQDVLVTKDF